MAVTPVRLVSGVQLTGAAAVYFTGPTGLNSVIKRAVFVNNDTVNHTVTAYIVKSGGTAGVTNIIIDAQNIPPGGSYISPELAGAVIGVNETLQMFADTGAFVTPTISGFQM